MPSENGAIAPTTLGGPWRSLVILATDDDTCGPDYTFCGRGGTTFGAEQGHARWGNYAWAKRIRNETDLAASIKGTLR